MKKIIALKIHRDDDVATMFMEARPGCEVCVRGLDGQTSGSIDVMERVPAGHKIALRNIKIGQQIKKYGVVIGRATDAITKGSLVDIRNVESQRGRGDQIAGQSSPY